MQRDGNLVWIARNGLAISATVELKIDLPRAPGTSDRGGNVIDAPLHGVVSHILVAVGDAVEKGSAVMQMEAMKLIHTLTAPVFRARRRYSLQGRRYRAGRRSACRNHISRCRGGRVMSGLYFEEFEDGIGVQP